MVRPRTLVAVLGLLAGGAALGACTPAPDPDALLRRHDLSGAEAAWKQLHGEEIDLNHHVVDVLAQRAASDPSITMASTLDALEAARLLDRVPTRGMGSVDIGFDSLESVLGAAGAIAKAPALVVVGRSATPADKDPYEGGPLPWRSGVLVGWTRADPSVLGRETDKLNPTRLVTIAMQDQTGALWLTVHHQDGLWWATASTDAPACARVLGAGATFTSGGVEAVRAKYGRGLLPPGGATPGSQEPI